MYYYDFEIENRISQYGGSKWWVQFFQGIHVRIDIGIDISISIKPITTKFGKQVHLQGLIQMRQIKKVLVTSLRQDHVTSKKHLYYQSAYGHQVLQDGNLPWWALAHKVTWSFDHVAL